MNDNPYKSDFVNVNGVNLHYLDWGGSGETLLFLTGFGDSALLFHPMASRFTDNFHVVGLTRRGQIQSEAPESGYDLDTLTDDILGFMDSQNIKKAILIGHSMAGLELIRFTERYPERVLKLIFLDSTYNGKGTLELRKDSPIINIQPPNTKEEFDSVEDYAEHLQYLYPSFTEIWNESWYKTMVYELEQTDKGTFLEKDRSSVQNQLFELIKNDTGQHAELPVPVLSFFAFSEQVPPEYYTEEQKQLFHEHYDEKYTPFRKKSIKQFINNIPHAKIIEIPGGNHYCHLSHEDLVVKEMLKFLSD